MTAARPNSHSRLRRTTLHGPLEVVVTGERQWARASLTQEGIGITAQRYSLILYGNSQKLKIEPWEPETARTATADFAWKADTWYRLKLRVESLANGQTRARGKVWADGQPEPAAWAIDKTDPIGNAQGAPGLFIDAQFGAYVDNMVLSRNQ